MTIENICKICGGRLTNASDSLSTEIADIVIDSRKISKGAAFIATRGERVDGHSFIGQVVEKGAALIVGENEPEPSVLKEVPYLKVEDSFKALRDMAAFYRQQLSVKIIGITGSVGKTSTKEVIASVVAERFKTQKTQGNFNNEVGVPLTLFTVDESHEVAVVEMGINHFGEMHRLAEMARPNICVYTNIGQCHLEFLGSRDGILKAKTEMLEHLSEGATAVMNGDDDKLATVTTVQGRPAIFFGQGENASYKAKNIQPDSIFGSSFTIETPQGDIDTYIPLPGQHQIQNALAAAAVGHTLGMTNAEIDRGIRSVKSVGGRSNIIRAAKYTVIDDCYNANPVSMGAALELLAQAPGRHIAILGDMFELGDNEKALHAGVGEKAVATNTDVIICVGTLSEAMYTSAVDKSKKSINTEKQSEVLYFHTRDEMMEALPAILKDGDSILIKASHGMAFTAVVEMLTK